MRGADENEASRFNQHDTSAGVLFRLFGCSDGRLGRFVCVRVGFLGWLGVCVDWFVGGRVRVGMPGLVGCMGRAGGVF